MGVSNMVRIILLYGVISGAIIIGIISLGMSLGPDSFLSTEWAGYLVMLVALSMIFAAVKRYRDLDLGGVIRFSTALGLGLGVAVVSSVVYVAVWETYLWTTDYRFFAEYSKSAIEAKRAGGASAAELAKLVRALKA